MRTFVPYFLTESYNETAPAGLFQDLRVLSFWLGNRDSNPNRQSQSLQCYRYTIPQYLLATKIYYTQYGRARRCLRGGRAAPPTARPLSHPGPPPTGWVGAGRTVPSAPRAGRAVGPGGSRLGRQRSERTGSAAMSATHPTRLETRTKESNTCASQGLARKPPWRNEGEGRPRRRPRWDPEASPSPPRAHHRPVSPAAPGRWSMSARVRTRKMVNYAWAGRSQRKLWWRSVAVLTCKSVVRPGYRGERLIEPSSSWFPPKFPSG